MKAKDISPAMLQQLDAEGRLRHLITLEGLPRALLERLLNRAQQFIRPLGAPPARSSALAGVTVANLFGEASTRTRGSFELAAHRLGADVINLEVHLSSRSKGETILDTVYTLQATRRAGHREAEGVLSPYADGAGANLSPRLPRSSPGRVSEADRGDRR
jgi:hypothetical protein